MTKNHTTKPVSRARNRTPDQTRAYLDRVLSLNPLVDANRMVRLRDRFCGLQVAVASPKPTTVTDNAGRRGKIQAALKEIRSNFWLMNGPDLRSQLDGLNASGLPELKTAIDRLKMLTLYRDEIQSLSKHPKREINLYNTWRRILMTSPRKAGSIKEKYLRAMPYSQARKRAQLMVKMLKRDYPQLYNLESDWFTQIEKIKARDGQMAATQSQPITVSTGDTPGWVIWICIFFGFKILIAIARMFSQ